jgi:hypothetical protein
MIRDICKGCSEVKPLVSAGIYKNERCQDCALEGQEEGRARAKVAEREQQKGKGV